MGTVVGMMLGAGCFLLWWSAWVPAPGSEPEPSRQPTWRHQAHDTLVHAGMPGVGIVPIVLLCLVFFLATFVLLIALTASAPVSFAFAVMAGWLPVVIIRLRARRHRARLEQVWPDVVDHLSSAIRAGMSLPEALSQLALRGPEPLQPAFAMFATDFRATGKFTECLDRLKEQLADPVADRICEALRMTRDVGGCDLGRLLRSLSMFLREDARTRSELQARQSWTINAARVAVAAPWLVLGMFATHPESLAAYNSTAGVIVLAVGAFLSVVAYKLMLRIARLPREERVLR